MKMLVLGAGRMGLGAAFDFAQQHDVETVTVADMDGDRVREIAARIGSKAKAVTLDVSDANRVTDLMRGHAATLSCVVYRLNEHLARCAIEAGTNFCDLGGNNDVVAAELALDAATRERGVSVIPDCGLAPGMVAVLVAHGLSRFREAQDVHIRVGGLPQDPQPPLDYQLVFSVEGLINEYIERARVLRDGRIIEIESMTEIEPIEFPPPFGMLEAFQTSGGTSTLPDTYKGRVRNLDYKTIRFRGHCEKFRTMIDLGLCSSGAIPVDGAAVVPRRLFAELLLRNLPKDGPDVVLVRVEFAGGGKRLCYDIIDRFDERTGLSAMMRTTAFPAAIVALMMARGQIEKKGAQPQERCVPPDLFMQELAKREIDVVQSWL
jgi:lysine 6-dehydrogenase